MTLAPDAFRFRIIERLNQHPNAVLLPAGSDDEKASAVSPSLNGSERRE
jgi:hypothetical protein